MAGGIFLVGDNDHLVEMTETPYDSEDILQELLAKYPNLLAGDQIDSQEPRRWLLVSREMGLPSDEVEGSRWSVDHLFLDQDGIPTLVEVKRGQNTQIRREVIGQLLEYAANAVTYWPVERILAELERRCEREHIDTESALNVMLGSDTEIDDYWEHVRTNLQAGRVRLVFVADVIPRELRRIVEFLNSQMDPADVFALEVKQFKGSGLTTLVPRLIGASERKAMKRTSRKTGKWDETLFLDALSRSSGENAVVVAQAVIQWARSKNLRDSWGRGSVNGSYIPVLDLNGESATIFSLWTEGRMEIHFQYLLKSEPFVSIDKRIDFAKKLNGVPGVSIPLDAMGRRPTFLFTDIQRDSDTQDLLSTLDWALEEIKNA